ncbi:TIM barrel protein [Castellaniella sp.]|uniref:sugar phosphate isomerase/epimerase family protein n=1 Tax=Castellaniella sp. TaxID=1955812 RepID=UPI0025B88AA0|nr:TIM barrel protein [Castellaniella sp.]
MMTESCVAMISLTAFGASEVRRHGQAWFARLSHEAGADGVEVRGELLRGDPDELGELSRIVADTGMRCVYSSPRAMWDESGRFSHEAVAEGLDRARVLGAATLKMSIGGFPPGDAVGWRALKSLLAGSPAALLVENDQRACSGTQPALEAFFRESQAWDVPLGMTFDVGNWHWVGESPLEMARVFAGHVQYIHCKGVFRRPDKWVAVPLEQSSAPWRAILRALPADAARAIEYPLVGEDLCAVTRQALDELRHAR